MKFKVRLDNQEREVEVTRLGERLRIVLDGETVEARLVYQEGPRFVLEYGEAGSEHVRRLRAAGYLDGDRRQLWVNGSLVNYTRVREQSGAAASNTAGSLSASIPAVVSEVLVQPGDSVTAGQKLILLESMKMILPIQAPQDGRVTAVHCAPGEAVQPGVPLVELAESEDGGAD